MIRGAGQWEGAVVLVGGDDWSAGRLTQRDQHQIAKLNITTQHFPEFDLSQLLEEHVQFPVKNADSRLVEKTFQWHKLYVFNVWFQQWDVVLYIDVGCKIEAPIDPFFNLRWQGRLLAHSGEQNIHIARQ
jgi:hypothetical protein